MVDKDNNQARAAELDAKLRKADASCEGESLDKALSKINDAMAKLDAFFAKKDAEDCEKMNKAKKDAEDDEDADRNEAEKLVADRKRAKADSSWQPNAHDEIATAWMRADSVYRIWSKEAPHAMPHETPRAYRERLLRPMQAYSESFGKADLSRVDDAALAGIEGVVYNDAIAASRNPDLFAGDNIREVHTRDRAGRDIVSFVCQPRTWLSQFTAPSQRAIINTDRAGRAI